MSSTFTITGDNWYLLEKAEELRLATTERLWAEQLYPVIICYGWDAANGLYHLDAFAGDMTISDTMPNNLPAHGKGFNMQSIAFLGEMRGFISVSYDWDSYQPLFTAFAKDWDGVTNPFSTTSNGDLYCNLQFGTDTDDAWLDFCRYAGGGLYTSDTDYGWQIGTIDTTTGLLTITHDVDNTWPETGEIIGPWIIENLTTAFAAMITKLNGFSYWDTSASGTPSLVT